MSSVRYNVFNNCAQGGVAHSTYQNHAANKTLRSLVYNFKIHSLMPKHFFILLQLLNGISGTCDTDNFKYPENDFLSSPVDDVI